MNNQEDKNEVNYYLKLLVKSSFFILIASIISKLASYGYKILIARYLGAEIYGLFSLALIVISLVSSIAVLGLGDGLVRYVSFYRGKKQFGKLNRLIISSKKIFLTTGIISAIALILFAPLIAEKIFHSDKFTPIIRGMAMAMPFLLLSNLYLGILKGFEKIKIYSSLVNIYQNSARFILLGLLLLIGFDLKAISISYVVVFIGLFLISRSYANKNLINLPDQKIPPSKKVMPEVLRYSWPLIFVGILYSIFYWIDSLFLGYLTNAENVGLYNAAVTLVALFSIAPDLFMQLFFPLIAVKFSEGKKEIIRKLTQQVTKWIYLLNIILFLLLFLFADKWITILFGEEFLVSTNILRILVVGALFSGVVGISTNLISIKGKTKLTLLDFTIFALVNIALNALLIPPYGMVGAAVATLTTQVAFAITLVLQVRRLYGFNPIISIRKRMSAIFVGFLIAGTYLVRNQLSIIMTIFFSILISILYLTSLYFFKLFDDEDLKIFRSIINKIKR